MHWSYGTSWGGAYSVARACAPRLPARVLGLAFGIGVWASSYLQLVPAGIYEPPWRYPLASILDEIGYHLTYGVTTALAYDVITRP